MMNKITKEELSELINQRNDYAEETFAEMFLERDSENPNVIANNYFESFALANDKMIEKLLKNLDLLED
ncbi:hypothetical protein 8F8_37 [uncultured Caudovirales phage]|mgnify:FL=1|uniref:Uncharacterized protein n=1 Tax=uncultured Caudovirales phage TaxID=2100421 RepID=A0A2H4J4K0_9CAUD|nr:hypothetical protein 8F8_37 [uncultured Caudovirales phage]